MRSLADYQILEKLYESHQSLVYRAQEMGIDHNPLVLKILHKSYPSPEELSRFQREFSMIQELKGLEGVIRAYRLERHKTGWILVLEDFGGKSLVHWMGDSRVELTDWLDIAIQVTEHLALLHQQHIIHKDISPSNILWNPQTGKIKLIDFGVATTLPREITQIRNPSVLEGTLAYMSPEQTGRMNCPLDYRTDLYSWGATLYHLLTEEQPFPTDDTMELVHGHIAKMPVPPHEKRPHLPPVLSEIILKLMSKNVDDRYQSAYGLKSDLVRCRDYLNTIRDIPLFTIGLNDVSDRFRIPQKLYGRDMELEQLLESFERVGQGHKESVLVTGTSGTGKTALIRELQKPIVKKRGYFISGKFDQLKPNTPYASVIQAFQELVAHLITEREEQVLRWKEKLLSQLGDNGQVIIDVIPQVELILGKQPPVAELPPLQSRNRFHRTMQKFVSAFASAESPLVIFLDDLQWADTPSLQLLQTLMTNPDTQYVCFLGSYRHTEVDISHPLTTTVKLMEQSGIRIRRIDLSPLAPAHVRQLVLDTFRAEPESLNPLAVLCYQKTQGNPFFLGQFLHSLYAEQLIEFDEQQGMWRWDLAKIRAQDITSNVVDLMASKIQKLPERTQHVLKLASCLGNHFDLKTLSIANEKTASATAAELWHALREGLIVPKDHSYKFVHDAPNLNAPYKFLHDRVQQATYSLIPAIDKAHVHWKIGKLLRASFTAPEQKDRLFDIVNQLNMGVDLLKDVEERANLAQLNYEAGQKAKASTAYEPAFRYLTYGMRLLNPDCWASQYQLTFRLYRDKAEVAYLNNRFEESRQLVARALPEVRSPIDRGELYIPLVVQLTLQAKYTEAIQEGRQALHDLGILLPEHDLDSAFLAELEAAKINLRDRSVDALLDEPEMQDPEKKAAIRLMIHLHPPTYISNPKLYDLLVVKIANLSLKYGPVTESAKGYSTYGNIVSSALGDYQTGYQFGQLALRLSERYKDPAQKCKTIFELVAFINHWVRPLHESSALSEEGYQLGLESGDLPYAGYNLMFWIINPFFEGKNLESLQADLDHALQFVHKAHNRWVYYTLLGIRLILNNLRGFTENPQSFHYDNLEETTYLAKCQQYGNHFAHTLYHLLKCQVAYLYGDVTSAFQFLSEVTKKLSHVRGTMATVEHNFYHSLCLARLYPDAPEPLQQEYKHQIQTNQEQLKQWVGLCEANFLHKYVLIEAEQMRLSGKALEAMQLYNQSIELARKHGFPVQEALANECAAQFHLQHGIEDYADLHITRAHHAYTLWGSRQKTAQMEKSIPSLLTNVAPPSAPERAEHPNHADRPPDTTTSLDLMTVMKASYAISGEIVLSQLLERLMNVVIEHAGAQTGFLIMVEDGYLSIEAEGSVGDKEIKVLQSIPVDSHPDLCEAIINYVFRTQDPVVLANAAQEGPFTSDEYVIQNQTQSVLCTPILYQGRLTGILYLENTSTPDVFTPDRLETLQFLSVQTAISIENALMYGRLEEKVKERTTEVEEALAQLEQKHLHLKEAQVQLVQSEKMASLGLLVAGVAHEINNPAAFAYAGAENLEHSLHRLKGNLLEATDEDPEVQQTLDNWFHPIFLDVGAVLDGIQRINIIVKNLRTFSRVGEAQRKRAHVVEGLESTLYLVKANFRKHVEFIYDFQANPMIECWPAQLNQVFMNVIVNACQAIQAQTTQTRHSTPGILTIRTFERGEKLAIQFEDNGCGMSVETQAKIFEPFFTTKPAGGGMGLGLSISYGIIQNHGGSLDIDSVLGRGTLLTIWLPLN